MPLATHVSSPEERRDLSAQVPEPGVHVEDRLGGEPGYGGAADMLDRLEQPRRKSCAHQPGQARTSVCPTGVGLGDGHLLGRPRGPRRGVGHRASTA